MKRRNVDEFLVSEAEDAHAQKWHADFWCAPWFPSCAASYAAGMRALAILDDPRLPKAVRVRAAERASDKFAEAKYEARRVVNAGILDTRAPRGRWKKS